MSRAVHPVVGSRELRCANASLFPWATQGAQGHQGSEIAPDVRCEEGECHSYEKEGDNALGRGGLALLKRGCCWRDVPLPWRSVQKRQSGTELPTKELAELRLHCGRAEAEKLGPLRERCKKQAKEISYLEHRYQNAQDEIRHLRSLLCKNQGIILNCTGDADQVDHSSLPCNSPSCIQDKEWLLEKLRSSEWQVCRMEKYVDELNVALTRRVLELNELQLFCSQQAKELMEISRKNFESSRNSSNQASRNSEMSFSVERTSAPCDLRVTPPITRIVQED